LGKTNNKFIARFQLMEELVKQENRKLEDMSLSEMDIYWERAKLKIKNDL
jgi:XTP/dITP diphosphohydrolase